MFSVTLCCYFFNDPATPDIYTYCHTRSLHDALPIYVAHEIKNPLASLRSAIESLSRLEDSRLRNELIAIATHDVRRIDRLVSERSEEHTSELQSLMRISYAVFCLKKQNSKLPNKSYH